jgi:dolichol-phosphate mannosyltransferase
VGVDLQSRETLVFLATYNERSNVDRLLHTILTLPISCDVLVIDDNSPDGTGTFLKERVAANERITLISRAERLGVGSAHRLGWAYARRFGYRRIVTLDADFSHDPLDIPRLVAALDAGADVALGSRFIPGGKCGYKGWRLFLSRTANSLARRLLGLPIREYTTSFRAANLNSIPFGLIETIPNDGYAFFLTAAVRLARHVKHITEVPICFRERHSGISKIPKTEIFFGFANLVGLFLDQRTFEPTAVAPHIFDDLMEFSELHTR